MRLSPRPTCGHMIFHGRFASDSLRLLLGSGRFVQHVRHYFCCLCPMRLSRACCRPCTIWCVWDEGFAIDWLDANIKCRETDTSLLFFCRLDMTMVIDPFALVKALRRWSSSNVKALVRLYPVLSLCFRCKSCIVCGSFRLYISAIFVLS